MASNKIPRTYAPLVQLAEDAADGLHAQGAGVGVAQNTEAKVRADLEAVVGRPAGPGNVPPADPGLKARLNAALADKVGKTGLKNSAQSNGRALASQCLTVLKPRLGTQWNSAWNAAGFSTGSLEIPGNPLTLLQGFAAYFAANPTHEVADLIPGLLPKISVTAAACSAAAKDITDASAASNTSNQDAGTAKLNLDAGLTALRGRMSGLLAELGSLLGDEDSRWYAFGFNRPADPESPEVPEHVVVTPGAAGSGRVFADWDDARRADTYRATVNDAATGAELASKIVEESEATFDGLPAGAAVKVTVTGRNADGGESGPSLPGSGTVAA